MRTIASVGFLEAFFKMASEKYQSKSKSICVFYFLKEATLFEAKLNL